MANKWVKGMASPNPKGRPKKEATLTNILEELGGSTQVKAGNGKTIVARRRIAQLIWQAATTGRVDFGDGRVAEFEGRDWFSVVKFIFERIDGPAGKNIDDELETEREVTITIHPPVA